MISRQIERRTSSLLANIAIVSAVLFGVALIANTQLAGDGGWFWYAKLGMHGARLYSELGLPLQPFFPLETRIFMQALGDSWIATRVQPLVHLLLFIAGLRAVVRCIDGSEVVRATLFLFGFFFGIHFVAYRFDDFHVVTDTLFLFSIAIVARANQRGGYASFKDVGLLGVLAGIAFTTRVVDGALLVFFDALALAAFPLKRLASLGLFVVTFVSIAMLIISSSGDNLTTWASVSLFHAAAIKGGSSLAMTPALFLQSALEAAMSDAMSIAILMAYAVAFSIVSAHKKAGSPTIRRLIAAIIAFVSLPLLYQESVSGPLDHGFEALGVIALYIAAIDAMVRVTRSIIRPAEDDRRQYVLVFVPFFSSIAGALSSGGRFGDTFFSIALFGLIVPIVYDTLFIKFRRTCLFALGAITISSAIYRYQDPLSWENYKTYRMFESRHIINHPLYGPMIIDDRLAAFAGSICHTIDASKDRTLLSIPFPYMNYYCGIAPWHNFVQSWYDLTSAAVIAKMTSDLTASPPHWVLYQHQPEMLLLHERTYNTGKPLPHRTLDDLILKRMKTHEWKVAVVYHDSPENDWYLIDTGVDRPTSASSSW